MGKDQWLQTLATGHMSGVKENENILQRPPKTTANSTQGSLAVVQKNRLSYTYTCLRHNLENADKRTLCSPA